MQKTQDEDYSGE